MACPRFSARPSSRSQEQSSLPPAELGFGCPSLGENEQKAPEEATERIADLPRVVIHRGADEAVPSVRQMPITRPLIEKFGFTPGCRKCEAMRIGDPAQPTLGHNNECRVRIEGLVSEDPDFAHKLTGARARQDEFLARRVEQGDESAQRMKVSRQGDQDRKILPGEQRTGFSYLDQPI